LKYLYDITGGVGLILVSAGVGIEFGYTWGVMLAGGLLFVLSVLLSLVPYVTSKN
jgi:hypothetical protein